MSRPKSMAAIAAACLMVAMSAAVWAQNAGRDSCTAACDDAKTRCINACETHDNPIECEEDCEETAEDCTFQCR